ncbi:hypothetical protein [Chitinolyticbacter meiyuanensis]|uniref:hypothetical protein n=1 Tax=Chitinolyticbacter meiyuanensis TaxID=682798 RepID=UPI0011E5E34B|nr:hypothetical protein [Chitinolyticbacter meiyuanensis]
MKVWFRRLLALWTTAFPGIQRLTLVLVVERTYGPQLLGQFSNDLGIAGLLGYFTAVGLCGLTLVQLPRAQGAEARGVLGRHAALQLLLLALAVPVIWGLARTGDTVVSGTGLLYFLAGWSLWQLMRHAMIAKSRYGVLSIIDACLFGIALIPLFGRWPNNLADLFLFQSLPYLLLLLPLGWLIVRSAPWRQPVRQWRSDGRRGVELGLANLFTGGVMMAVPPYAMNVGGTRYAALFGLLLTLLGVALLVPRAMALQMIPQLARHRDAVETLRAIVLKARRRLLMIAVCVLIVLSSAWFALQATLTHWAFTVPGATVIALLLITYLAISQLSIVSANVLQVFEDSFFIFSANGGYLATMAIAALALALSPWSGLAKLVGVLVAVNLCALIRMLAFDRRASRLLGVV